MKSMITSLCLIIMTGISTGCQQVQASNNAHNQDRSSQDIDLPMSNKERQIADKLQWVKSADPVADATAALEAKDSDGKLELIAFSGRGKSFPGLTKAQYESIEDHVTYRYAEGSGDIIYGATHKKLRQQLRDYVSQYNTIIYTEISKTP